MKVYIVTITKEYGGPDFYREFVVDKVFYTEAAAHNHRLEIYQGLNKYGEDYRFSYDVEVTDMEIE